MIKTIKKLFSLIKSEQAVLFSVLATGWRFVAGPLTIAIIGARFTPELQGYYITFLSVLGYSAYLQMGLGRVIIQFASHEWAKLSFDKNGYVVGDEAAKARLANLARFAVKWYLVAGIIAIAFLTVGGTWFFMKSKNALPQEVWLAPWISMAVLCGIQMMMMPLFYLLEGCNQVKYVYRFRFFQAIVGNVSIWIAVYSDAKLWTYSVFFTVWILSSVLFLRFRYWNFLKSIFISNVLKERFNWFKELMPLQIKLVIFSFCSYMMFQFYIQGSMFARGPARACQTGTTISFIMMLGTVMGAFIGPKMPLFGVLIAEKKYKELDNQFIKLFFTAASLMIIGGMALWLGVLMLNVLPFHLAKYYAERLLEPAPTAIFTAAYIFWSLSASSGLYLIAHKKMPHIWIVAITTILSISIMIFLGNKYGITLTGIGLLIIQIFMFPIILLTVFYYRKKWHKIIN